MEKNVPKSKIIFNFVYSRGLSTIMAKFFSGVPNCFLIKKPMRSIRVHKILKTDPSKTQDITSNEQVEKIIDNYFQDPKNDDPNHFIYVDFSTEFFDDFKEEIQRLMNKYNCKFIFLGRHPTSLLASVRKIKKEIIDKHGPDPVAFYGLEQKHLCSFKNFDYIKKTIGTDNCYHFSTDLLLENPGTELTALFNYLEIKFDKSYLSFPNELPVKVDYIANDPCFNIVYGDFKKEFITFENKIFDMEKLKNTTILPNCCPEVGLNSYFENQEEEIKLYEDFIEKSKQDYQKYCVK